MWHGRNFGLRIDNEEPDDGYARADIDAFWGELSAAVDKACPYIAAVLAVLLALVALSL
jgi:hypothetical protein